MFDCRGARCTRVALRRICLSSRFWLSALLLLFVLLVESVPDWLTLCNTMVDPSVMFAAYEFNISIHFGYYIYAAPLLAAFAASGLFCEDARCGFHRLAMMKCGRKAYKAGLFGGVTIGGGLVLMIGVVMYSIVLLMIFIPNYPIEDMAVAPAWEQILGMRYGGIVYMVTHAFLAFLFGMVWSGMGLVVSLYSPVSYVSFLAPFIICFCINVMMPNSLQPLEMLVQMGWQDFTFGSLLIYQTLCYLVIAVWFKMAFDRRALYV